VDSRRSAQRHLDQDWVHRDHEHRVFDRWRQTYPNVIVNGVAGGALTYQWTIPNNLSQACRVRISDASDAAVYDISNNDFKIRGSFAVTSPNGGEVWEVATVHDIEWTRNGSIINAKLEYSTDGGNTYPFTIVGTVDASLLAYPWLLPDAITTQVRVRISDASDSTVYDASDANFKIRGVLNISSPNGTEDWDVATSHDITWVVTGSIVAVRLDYSTDGGTTYPNQIVASTSASNVKYTWSVPDAIGTQVRVKITNLARSDRVRYFGRNFKIKEGCC
jgi:hypothetical protein